MLHACMTPEFTRTELNTQQSSLATTDAGKHGVRVDFHLCYAEAKSSAWSSLSGQPLFKTETTVFLLDLVYFFWYEERQLSRGAKVLVKVPSHVCQPVASPAMLPEMGNTGALTWHRPCLIRRHLPLPCAQTKAPLAGSAATGGTCKEAITPSSSQWTSPVVH